MIPKKRDSRTNAVPAPRLIRKISNASKILLGVLAAAVLASLPAAAQNTWTGAAGTTNWSDLVNWSFFAVPSTSDDVLFDNINNGVATGVVDNIVDANFTVLTLTYQTTSTRGYHTTQINPGVSLNLTGNGTNGLTVGTGATVTGALNVYDRFVGGGTLSATNSGSYIFVAQGGDGNDHYATLDLSGLTNLTMSIGQIFVGCIPDTVVQGLRPMGIMRLADTNYIQTAASTTQPGIMVACYPTGDTNLRGTQQLFLGRHNVISSDAIAVGGTKTTGQILSRPGITNGYALIRGSAGGSDKVKIFAIGDGRAGMFNFIPGGTSVGDSGTFDATGTFLDAAIVDLYVARSQTNNNGATTGVLTFDQGSITADNAFVGFHPTPSAATGTFNGTGTVNVNGNATLAVNNDLIMAKKVGPTTPVATLNLSSNGTIKVSGNIIASGGTTTINFNNGGTIDLQPSGDPAPGFLSVGTITGSGTVANAANVTNTVALTPGTTTAIGTLNIANNLTLASGATVNFNIGGSTAPSANDVINVTGNLNLNNNTLTLLPLASTLASGSSYTLISFTGTRSGTFNFTNPTRYTAGLTYGANSITLDVSGAPGGVKWNSIASAAWDLTSLNWLNTATSTPDKFLQLDNVLVDDSVSATNLLLLGTALFPNTVTVNSSTRDYSFGGSGKISGAASLTKSGTSMLTISNANDFTGAVAINGGTLRVINASALGTTNSGTTIANGATLDVFGQALYTPGESITVSGAGYNNQGAIINTGAAQNNAIRFLTLAGNTTVTVNNRWDVRGPGGSGSFSGMLDLGGFTYTKLGTAQSSLVDSVITNAGNIVIGGGIMGLTRSMIDGPGYIDVMNNILQFENSSTGYLAKPITVSGGTIRVTGNAVALTVPITNSTGVTIDNSVALSLNNSILGAGGLTKISAGVLTLAAPNTYSGPTMISAGQVILSTNGTLANTPSIAVIAGASLDVSTVNGGFVLGAGQTLLGGGGVGGDFMAAATASFVPGNGGPGTLFLSNNVAMNGVTNLVELGSDPTMIGNNANDLVAIGGSLTLNGLNTIKVAPIGPLSADIPYTVITYGGGLTGGAANLKVISDNPRYTFSIVDPNTTPGSIQVMVSGVPTTLVWKGGAVANPTVWDGSTANWLNGGLSDTFFAGDNVQFDDSSSTNFVTVSGTQQPGSITLNNTSKSYTFAGAGSVKSGSLAKQGSASVTFGNGGSNSFSSAFAVSGGGVSFTNGGANTFAVGSPVMLNSGSLTFQNGGGNDFIGGLMIESGAFTVANAGSNSFGATIALDDGSLVVNQSVSATIGAAISGGIGTLTKQGTNLLTLSGNNSGFGGPIVVSAGMLRAGNANALGSAGGMTTVASGATLDVNGFALYNPGDVIMISGAGLSNTGAVINTGAAQNNAIRALMLANDATIAAWGNRWDVRGNGGSGSFSGLVDLQGYTLYKIGPGTNSIVDADVTSNGSIENDGGELHFTRCYVDGTGVINMSSNILVLENYTLGYMAKPLVSRGGTLRVIGNSFMLNSPVTNLTGITVDVASGLALTSLGSFVGTGPYTKITAGTNLLMATDNTWGGSTTISAGAVQVGNGGFEGSLPNLPIINNGALVMNTQYDYTNDFEISGTGLIVQNFGGTIYLNGSNSYAGTTLINSVTTSPNGSAIRISNSYALGTTAGNTRIAGNGTGNGRLELVGNITTPEPILIDCRQGGTIDIPAIVNVSGSNTMTGQFTGNTGGSDMNIQSDSGKLTLAGGFNCTSTAGTRRLKLMGDAFGEWSGIISNSVDGLVPTILVKAGNGTWTLSGANIYNGATTIRAGKLAMAATGSIANSPMIDVQTGANFDVSAATAPGFTLASGQTLQGEGSVTGALIAGSGSTISPATAATIGTLTFNGSLTMQAGSTCQITVDKNTGTNDVIVCPSIQYGGMLVVTEINGVDFAEGDTFKVFATGATSGGTFAAASPLPSGLMWDFSALASSGIIKVVPASAVSTTPVPLQFSITGNSLTLSWPSDHTGWHLEAQTNSLSVGLTSTWTPVSGTSSTNSVTLQINPANPTVFYRLTYP